MMRTIQEIFNVVIDEGCYSNVSVYSVSTGYMCGALYNAHVKGHITEVEKQQADAEIEAYLGGYVFLRYGLSQSGLPHTYEDRLAVYKDWANRPQLTHNLWV